MKTYKPDEDIRYYDILCTCLVQGAGMVWSPSTALGWQRLWYSIGRWRHSRHGFGSWYPSQLAGNRTQPPFPSNRVDRIRVPFTCVMFILTWCTGSLDFLWRKHLQHKFAHVGGLLEKAKYLSVTSGSVWLGILVLNWRSLSLLSYDIPFFNYSSDYWYYIDYFCFFCVTLLSSFLSLSSMDQPCQFACCFGQGIPFYYQTLDSLEDYLGSTLKPEQMLPQEVVKETGSLWSDDGTGMEGPWYTVL